MLILVISDLHLGTGAFYEDGTRNMNEDFLEDERFVEYLEHYSTDKYAEDFIHLVLNGDIFNLLVPDTKSSLPHAISEKRSVEMLEDIARGHATFFEALKKFAKVPNKQITYIIGNHDAAMDFPAAQEYFCELIDQKIEFAFKINLHGVHIEHGHRFEVINTVPRRHYYLNGPENEKILNLPWGSLFCLYILPELKNERPFIDKVRPIKKYILWCILHDPKFFLWMAFKVIGYLIKMQFTKYSKGNTNFTTSFALLRQVSVYPKYEHQARRILNNGRYNAHTVILGHSHIAEWRKFPDGKLYLNSGTWNPIPSVDAGQHESASKLTYVSVRIDPKIDDVKSASLNLWQGKWRPFREWISLNDNRLL